MPITCRLAPSPTGRMHAGNIYASLISWLYAKSRGGEVVLRIEDLDEQRSRVDFAEAVLRDYAYLGITWDKGPYYQHDKQERYEHYFNILKERGLIYPCFCSRTDILAASAPHFGEKAVYPGTCRKYIKNPPENASELPQHALRVLVPEERYELDDIFQGNYAQILSKECGDFIVKRSDGQFAYQLAVVVDDALQGVNTVIRGIDLLCSSPQQLYLNRLWGFNKPTYGHIPLLVSRANVRLSKRNNDASLDYLIAECGGAKGVIGYIAFLVGIIPEFCPMTPEELVPLFSLDALRERYLGVIQIPWVPPQRS